MTTYRATAKVRLMISIDIDYDFDELCTLIKAETSSVEKAIDTIDDVRKRFLGSRLSIEGNPVVEHIHIDRRD